MSLEFRIARPFSRWRLKPEVGEPSYSYFAREVVDEGHDSLRVYANEIGLDGRNINPEQLLGSLESLPLDEEFKGRLRRATPVLRHGFYHLGDDRVRQKQLSCSYRRFCPQCLAEKPYHRVWWDLVDIRFCDLHHLELVTEVEGRRMNWSWPFFDHSPAGDILAKVSAKPAVNQTIAFHAFARNRLLGEVREEGPLASYELFDIIDASNFFSRWLQSGDSRQLLPPKQADIEFGFAILTQDEEPLRESFRQWFVERVPEQVRRTGLRASIPGYGGYWYNRPGSRLRPVVDAAVFDAFATVGTLGRKFVRYRPTVRADRTLLDAARELELPPKGLSKLIQRLDLLPGAKWNGDVISLDDRTFQKLRAAVEDLVPSTEVWELTGLPGHEFRYLVRAGLVEEFLGLPIAGRRGGRVRASEVKRLIGSVKSGAYARPTPDMITFFSHAKRLGLRQGELAVRVANGTLRPDAIEPDRPGFRACYFYDPTASLADGDPFEMDHGGDQRQQRPVDLAVLWDHLRARLSQVCPTFRLPESCADCSNLFTSNRKLALKVAGLERHSFNLVLELHPARTARRWEQYRKHRDAVHRAAEAARWTESADGQGVEVTFQIASLQQASAASEGLRQLKQLLA